MKKVILSLLLILGFFSSECLAKSWDEGDTAYIFARNAGKTTWFSKRPLIFYAQVSIERINNNNSKVKVYINKICWKTSSDEVVCNNESEGGFHVGSYRWVYKSDLKRWPF